MKETTTKAIVDGIDSKLKLYIAGAIVGLVSYLQQFLEWKMWMQ